MFIDTHAHLTFLDYKDDQEAVLERAWQAGLNCIINIGSGQEITGNEASLKLAKGDERIYSTVGFHPHFAPQAMEMGDAAFESILSLVDDPKVVAVGEIGLDYHYIKQKSRPEMDADKKAQIACFTRQIELSKKAKLPLIIHDREANEDVIFTLRNKHASEYGGVMHCFSGSTVLAKKVLDLGFYISITGAVTFKKKAEELQKVVQYVPIERLLIETDSPFIAPEPSRGKRNEPAFVVEVAKKIAELKNLSLEDVGRITSLNARKLFHLPGELPEPKIAYSIRRSLYLNITNRCNLDCRFCPKKSGNWEVKGYNLKLSREPDVEDIFKAMGDATGYKEVVFCGFGEPTTRLELLKAIAGRLKEQGITVRLDTDGLANLTHKRDILPELKGLIDSISVSLNAPDAKTYIEMCPSKYGARAFDAVLKFIQDAKRYIPEVTATAVTCPGVDIAECRRMAEGKLGVTFRAREYQEVG